MTVQTSRFGAWLRGLDAFAAQLMVMQRAPEAIDVCEDAAEEAALCEADEGDPDGDETGTGTSEPAAIVI